MYESILATIHDTYYDEYSQSVFEFLSREIHLNQDSIIVDLGCGSGNFLDQCNKKSAICYGVDISKWMIKLAKIRVPKAILTVSDIFEYTIPKCNTITMIGEILSFACFSKNYDEIEVYLKKIYSKLSYDGNLFFDFLSIEYNFTKDVIINEEDYTILNKIRDSDGFVTREITSFLRNGSVYEKSLEIHRLRKLDPSILSFILQNIGFEVTTLDSYMGKKLLPGRIAFLCKKRL